MAEGPELEMARALLLVILLLLVGGCGAVDAPPGGDASEARSTPITQRAIAAVALEHVPTDTTRREATYTDRDDGDTPGALGADLRYDGVGQSDGDLLRVFLSPETGPACEASPACVSRDVEDGILSLSWQEEDPEEDPGYVSVAPTRTDETVSVLWSGDAITGDPREQRLGVPVDVMEAVAQDPRLTLTTSAEVVAMGAALADWDGGEPDPHAHERVASTDRGLVNSYLQFHGGYAQYADLGSSPLTPAFGAGAIGGRLRWTGDADAPPLTIDVLAAPEATGFPRADPCSAYAGSCRARGRGRYLAWTPGPDGEVWQVAVRDGGRPEVVAVRFSGFAVGSRPGAVEAQTDWYLNADYLLADTVGLTTDQEILDFRP